MNSLLKSLFVVGLALIVVAPTQVFSQDVARNKEIQERFAKCDINRDGRLTPEEAKGCMPRIYSNFSRIDEQGKGYVTVAEIEVMAAR